MCFGGGGAAGGGQKWILGQEIMFLAIFVMVFLAIFVMASRQNYAFSQKIATQAYINESKFARNVKVSTQTLRSCVVLLII